MVLGIFMRMLLYVLLCFIVGECVIREFPSRKPPETSLCCVCVVFVCVCVFVSEGGQGRGGVVRTLLGGAFTVRS